MDRNGKLALTMLKSFRSSQYPILDQNEKKNQFHL